MSDDAPVKQFLEAIRGGDPKSALAVIDPHIHVSEPAGLIYGGEYDGYDAFLGIIKAIYEHYRTEIHEVRTTAGRARSQT